MNCRIRYTPPPARGGKRLLQQAFTFAEVLAALFFMAIVIPVAMKGLQISNRAGVVAARKSTAIQLGEEKLSELVATDLWRSSNPNGNFGNEWRNYSWRLSHEDWAEDTMKVVSIEVEYLVQGQKYYVRLSTLAHNTTSL
jgi:hypothetical protein